MENNLHTVQAQELFHNAPCGFLTMEASGRILDINNTLLDLLRYTREEVVDIKSFQDLLGSGGKIYLETHMMPLLLLQGNVSEINLEIQGRGSVHIPALVNAKKVIATDESFIFLLTILDITQRKQYENELLQARLSAEEKTRKLGQINQELEQFAHTASHDLQAPLNTISGLVYLLQKKSTINAGTNGEELFLLILRNTTRMKMMIKDLLEYTRLDGQEKAFETVSLKEACTQAVEILNEDILRNNAIIHIPDMPMVSGVKIQFIRLFQNLFSNAIKYRSQADPVIQVSWEKIDSFLVVRVKDNGMGFDHKNSDKIFDFMVRLHSNDTIAGTGIGLSACKRIVENHGGTIGVDSESGRGSTFYFRIPASEE